MGMGAANCQAVERLPGDAEDDSRDDDGDDEDRPRGGPARPAPRSASHAKQKSRRGTALVPAAPSYVSSPSTAVDK